MLPTGRTQRASLCQGDFAPYNCVFRDGDAVGVIDFDAAHPASRDWGIAYALYRFAPFTDPDNHDGFGDLGAQVRRERMFCDSYGL